jgi:hypothetical protein
MLRLITILCALTCLCAATAAAQQQKKVVGPEEPTALELSVKKAEHLPAEPVEVTLALVNDRDRVIKGDFYLGGRVKLFYRRAGEGDFKRYFPRRIQLRGMADGVSLSKPFEIAARGRGEGEDTMRYDTSARRYVLDAPGVYELRATFDFEGVYESNVVKVTVSEPPGDEAPALAALRDPVLASFVEGDLTTQLVADEEVEAGAEKAAAFLLNHPLSRYAPRVRDVLHGVLREAEDGGNLTPKLKLIRDTNPESQP